MTISATFFKQVDLVNIKIEDPTGHFSNSYSFSSSNADKIQRFVIPIGDTYTVTVTTPDRTDIPISFVTNSCQLTKNVCQGTMENTQQSVAVIIGRPPV